MATTGWIGGKAEGGERLGIWPLLRLEASGTSWVLWVESCTPKSVSFQSLTPVPQRVILFG